MEDQRIKNDMQELNNNSFQRFRSFLEREDGSVEGYVNFIRGLMAKREKPLLEYMYWRLGEMGMPREAAGSYMAGGMLGYELTYPDFEKVIPFPIRENRITQIKEVWNIGDYERYSSLLKQALGKKATEILSYIETGRKLLEGKGEGVFYFGAEETLTVLFWDKINSLINQ